ncbi:PREDICTED: maf-like protein DDB_G0281937 isoform X4 [Lupinus angustifolius]|uniref:maf-like protein DDB_G0281937 isoform X4 n=1 Tax=Lupinus angustifolius TaxID=3871 RepID=UPI00092FD318|nr:PREDICTED: maf-like protein DDB_G0281937 isoform X4 [Lupinus angustifolius]
MVTNTPSFKIILGSSSKARKQILSEMGYEFTILTADIDEQSIRREKPEDLVVALAEAKVVVYQGIIREKPTSEKEAREFVKGYSGSHAAVVGSVLVTNLATGKRYGGWESAEVYFLEIPDEVIDNLIDEGVTFNVAGGLMLEHPLTLPFVDAVVGSTDTVMGLSKELTEKLILEAL